MKKEYINKRFESVKAIVKSFYKDKKLDINQKLPLNDFVKWCKKNEIILLKTQTDQIQNPDVISLTLIELMTFITHQKSQVARI